MRACGLDFGTSNSTLGTMVGNAPTLLAIDGTATTLPSAIFFEENAPAPIIGRAAIAAYVDGRHGRFMRSLKSVLGTDLIDQDTILPHGRILFTAVLAKLLGQIKDRGETASGHPIDAVVHGRPVHFVDGDPEADKRAEATLAQIAHEVGFREVSFQYEPIAAALDYERQVTREEIALIADIGGGTSDFSIVRLRPQTGPVPAERMQDILANDGIRVGGTDFDRLLSLRAIMPLFGYQAPMIKPGLLTPNGYYTDLSTWSRINFLYTPHVRQELAAVRRESTVPHCIDRLINLINEEQGHRLAMAVEATKIRLGDEPTFTLPLGWIEAGLAAHVTRDQFEQATQEPTRAIGTRIADCLAMAGLPASAINSVFLTGGSTLLHHVRREILGALPDAAVVDGDKFGSVGLGLTLEAMRRYH